MTAQEPKPVVLNETQSITLWRLVYSRAYELGVAAKKAEQEAELNGEATPGGNLNVASNDMEAHDVGTPATSIQS
jgi:hypothetical protein